MEEYLTNKVIGKCYEGKSGEGEFGPWVAWNFHVEGDNRKFSYFSGGKKPRPFEGAFIQMAKYETVKKGQYTNHNIKELALGTQNYDPRQEPDGGPPDDYLPPGETPVKTPVKTTISRNDEKLSFYVSYAKDLSVALLNKGEMPEGYTLDDAGKDVMRVGKMMHREANEVPF